MSQQTKMSVVPLSRIHMSALHKFAVAGGSGRPAEVMNGSESANFSKLQFWGFIRRLNTSWDWVITEHGYAFLDREISVYKFAITFNGRLVKFEGDQIYYNLEPDALKWYPNHYARAARKLDHGQALLFA